MPALHEDSAGGARLEADYTPDDVSYNMEGQIKGGTLFALIAKLTSHETGAPASDYFEGCRLGGTDLNRWACGAY
jgi:hypothetical protein